MTKVIRMIKNLIFILSITLFVSQSLLANEIIKCYQIAWGHPQNKGLGLTKGQAIRLCGGTEKASQTIACYSIAWDLEEKGGLALTKGQAIKLCKNNSLLDP